MGTFKYTNGDIYSGMWENGKKHGKGTYVYSTTKYQIVGDWKNGEIVWGKWALTNGAHYIGGFKKQKPFGDGVWKFPTNTCVEGAYSQQIVPVDDAEPDKSGKPATETKVFWKTAAVISTEEWRCCICAGCSKMLDYPAGEAFSVCLSAYSPSLSLF